MRAKMSACTAAIRVAWLVAASVAASDAPAHAQGAVLTGSVQTMGDEVSLLGAADARDVVSFQVALKLRNKPGLDASLARGERLTAADLSARHLPAAEAYGAVRAWLTGEGLAVDRDTDDRLMIEVHGSVAQVGRMLGVGFVRVAVEGQAYVATRQAPRVPAAVAPFVDSINGLQPYQRMRRLGFIAPAAAAAGLRAEATPAVTYSGHYYPAGILRAYKALPYLTQGGQGTRTAILIDTLPKTTDLTAFWTLTGIAQSLSNIEFVQVASGQLPAPSGEETLDTEWASGIGYQSKVRVYAAGSLSFTALDAGFHKILSDLGSGIAINQLSISLGGCESAFSSGQINTDNNLLESIAAQGVSILVASGDLGARECGSGGGLVPSFYSTSPYVTAVGGTHLIVTAKSNSAQKVTIKSETAWSGSGGGVSTVFAKPAYQSALSYARRAVPDVAAVADPATGVEIVLDGNTEELGGTSVGTPIWAGLLALVNQARFASGLAALGPLNPRLYPLLGTANFRDVTSGGNGGYSAGAGYDLVTGAGSPVMNQLLPTLEAQP